jgi:hypothetical protein
LFFGLGPKAGHSNCNSEACGATIRAEWYFRAKKLAEKFGGIPAMQQQDFPRGKQAVVCPKSRSREEDVDFVDVKIDLGEMPSAIGTLPQ